MYFGFGEKEDKEAAIELYNDSANLDNIKSILALAAIYD